VDVIGIALRIDVDLESTTVRHTGCVWLWQQADDVPVEADEEAADKAVEMSVRHICHMFVLAASYVWKKRIDSMVFLP